MNDHRSHKHSNMYYKRRTIWIRLLFCLFALIACLHVSADWSSIAAARSTSIPTITSVVPNVINTGQPTTLSITGGNFVAPISVIARQSNLPFETALTNVTIINSTTITATFPAMSAEGLYDLEIKGSDGTPHDLFAALSVAYQGDGQFGPWVAGNPLPTKRAGFGAVTIREQLYILGGREQNDPFNTVERATLTTDGTIGPWTFAKSMITPRVNFAVASTDQAIYALGGGRPGIGSVLSSVEWAVVHPDGSLGDWQAANPMTSQRSDFAALILGNYVYALGGNGSATVERAAIGIDGSLGIWQPMSPMTTVRTSFAAVAARGYIYALGGATSGGASSVERAQVNPDGSLGTWELISRMTTSRTALNAVTMHGYIYALGGTSGIICSNTVERATFTLDGSLGAWEKVASMRLPRCNLGIVIAGDILLALGGSDDIGGIPSDQVELAQPVTYTPRAWLALTTR